MRKTSDKGACFGKIVSAAMTATGGALRGSDMRAMLVAMACLLLGSCAEPPQGEIMRGVLSAEGQYCGGENWLHIPRLP